MASTYASKATMELSVTSPVKRDSRKNSLIDTINSAGKSIRKDSVTPLLFIDPESVGRQSGKSSIASNTDVIFGTDTARRLSRRVSLKPPTNIYAERRVSPKASLQLSHASLKKKGEHTVKCSCGRELNVPCNSIVDLTPVPTVTLSRIEVNDLKKAFAENQKMAPNTLPLCSHPDDTNSTRRPSNVLESIETINAKPHDYSSVLKCCIELGHIEDQDSLEMVLSRQNAIKSLLDSIKMFPGKTELLVEACRSLQKQVQYSEASLHYVTVNDGIERLHTIMKTYTEHIELLSLVLDIFGYYSFLDEWRSLLTEKVNPSDFLTTMARHDCDVTIVEKCCVVVGNLVLSEDIARSMMYVGGVHSLISMMTKYDHNVDILKHCCTALGTFASHDDTCQAVAEAGATCAVLTVMTAFGANPCIQQSCCWALASLTRSDCVCMELMSTDAFNLILKTMAMFPSEVCIQEYGCWALCNLVVLGSRLEDADSRTAVEILIDSVITFTNNVELLEHIAYAISTLVSLKECVQETVVRRDGVSKLIDLMRHYEDNDEIQLNGCKVIGNIAVNVDFRCYIEGMGASEAVISSMLKMDKNSTIQNTGCMTLTNLSAECPDNKFRILKNGGVHAVLVAMSGFPEDDNVNLNALKVLSNLLESDKGCWWIAEESGIQIISMALKKFSESSDIVSFGCTCLSSLPRRGMNAIALQNVESTLLYLRQSMTLNVHVARAVCAFYENAMHAGKENGRLLNSNAMEKILQIMHDFDDTDIHISGCKIMAHIAIRENFELMTREVVSVLISTTKKFMDVEDVQVVCCGTISYLSSSPKGLRCLQDIWCIDLVLESMLRHLNDVQIQSVCLITLENICKAALVRGKNIQSVCDAVSKSMTTHANNNEIQTSCCHILSVIGSGFHRQNEQRRQSVDLLDTYNGNIHRKSMSDEILEVASATIQRLKRFTEDVSEEERSDSETQKLELESTNFKITKPPPTSDIDIDSDR